MLMEALWDAGARVQAYDPEAMEEAQRLYGDRDDLVLCGTKEAALKGADALVVMTEWQAFRAPDFDLIRERLAAPVIFDGRNLYDPARLARRGFTYYAIGRGGVTGDGRPRREGPRHRRRRLHRLPRRDGAAARAATRWRASTSSTTITTRALKEARLAELDRTAAGDRRRPGASTAPTSPTGDAVDGRLRRGAAAGRSTG